MFPYPREDQGGSNRNQFGQIIRLQLVSVPSRGLGGLTKKLASAGSLIVSFRTLSRIRWVLTEKAARIEKSKANKFPSPLEDWGGSNSTAISFGEKYRVSVPSRGYGGF